jgi:DNA-binding NarL/FixJ family response regulator
MKEAEILLARETYDCVIVDLRLTPLGGMEGLEILSRVRRERPAMRVVLLTGHASPEIEREAYRRGADAVVFKPVPLPKLAETIGALLAGPGRTA